MKNPVLIIKSTDFDLNGTWNATDVEAEMLDLEIPIKDKNSWLEYVLERDLIDTDLNVDKIVKTLIGGGSWNEITLKYEYDGGNWIKITYIR